ncbi:isocitrate/isopropylmalate family dehydrogenase [Pseudomonas bharatica]|uniref:isocitrate/isopropylmalate family dehydrogenase n=1 Tax=Pseudomonas bharatica TaxID=2692112 RepID=UPI00289E3FAF|nr:isocitrate/isopropylmalate family dehydrogenase [Pseudomonas bharatica]
MLAEGRNCIPDNTWKLIESSDATLLGAITSKPLREAEAELPEALRGRGKVYVSPVIQLRQKLGLFANVRPVTDVLGDNRYRFSVIRENTEGLYAGWISPAFPRPSRRFSRSASATARPGPAGLDDATMTVRLQTRAGLTRLFRFAFEHAREQGHDRVTLADKPNVLRYSGAFARDILETVAADYPDIGFAIDNVDAVALWMVRRPERFGVVVAENMFATSSPTSVPA